MMPLLPGRTLPPGTLIDGWRVVRELGSGGFGVVFLVEKEGRFHALKFALYPEGSGDEQRTHERTEREMLLLLMLRHPHLLRPRAFGQWPDCETGHAYLVTDYVEGWTLGEWAECTHPTAHEVARVFRKLASTLAYLHARGVLHRDLKPSNVLIRKRDGEPFLIDFGCAVHAHAEQLTHLPLPPGTDRYRTPELWLFHREHRRERGAHYSFQVADELFALGAMLYDVLTEPRPTAEFVARPALNHPRQPPPPPRVTNPRVPPALSHLAMALLEREPARRPVSATALERELAGLEEQRGPEYTVPLHPPDAQRAPPRREDPEVPRAPAPRHGARALAVGGTLLLGVLAAVLALLASAGRPAAPHSPPGEPRVARRARPPLLLPDRASDGPDTRFPGFPGFPLDPTLPPWLVGDPRPPAALQKEGVPVTTPPLDSPPSVPTRSRATHSVRFLAWCRSFSKLGTVMALTAGCPGAQVRPEPFECPSDAWEWMEQAGWTHDPEGILIDVDARLGWKSGWLESGPVVGVSEMNIAIPNGKRPVPAGTLFIGHLWVVPEKSKDSVGYVFARYDRVRFASGEEAPVCVIVGGGKEIDVEKFRNGKAWVPGPSLLADVVRRWKPAPRD